MQISPDTVRRIADLSRKLQASLPPESEGLTRADGDRLAAYATNPHRHVLINAIRDLPDDQRDELLALAWIGRDGLQGGDFAAALRTAVGNDGTAGYLAAKGPLADYLEAGLVAVSADA